MNIKLSDEYRIECNQMDYTVIKKAKHKKFNSKKDKEEGRISEKYGGTYETIFGYYSRLDSLVKGIMDDKIKTSEIDNLRELQLLVSNFGKQMVLSFEDELKRLKKENNELIYRIKSLEK